MFVCFVFKQKTAYEMRISDWSSDVCSSDLPEKADAERQQIMGMVEPDQAKSQQVDRELDVLPLYALVDDRLGHAQVVVVWNERGQRQQSDGKDRKRVV